MAALTRDDAAVYRLSDERALVATLDFFTPIVDDAFTFGAIAAANALSDLYAMGATPLFALNILAWPRDPDLLPLVGEAMRGAAEKMREAGTFILGGHSIEDREPKLGMVAIGEVHPERLFTNAGARPGDRLLLTKPMGTGILATALKQDMLTEREMPEAIRSMLTLNAGALAAVRAVGAGVHAMTDVTGFGLLGHLHTMLSASAVGARLDAGRVPAFPRVRELIEAGVVPGGTVRNAAAAAEFTAWSDAVDDATRTLLCDAQTSGGLLLAVDPTEAPRLITALRDARTPVAVDIGECTVTGEPLLEIVHERA